MMMLVIGGFGVCWFPFAIMFVLFPTNEDAREYFSENLNIVELITWIGKKQKTPTITFLLVIIICISGYANSSLNPIIYFFMNPSIKKICKDWYESFRN